MPVLPGPEVHMQIQVVPEANGSQQQPNVREARMKLGVAM